MKEKVLNFIKLYRNLTEEKAFAEKQIKKIIEWSWMAKDMEIIDQETHTEIYSAAIDALVYLDE